MGDLTVILAVVLFALPAWAEEGARSFSLGVPGVSGSQDSGPLPMEGIEAVKAAESGVIPGAPATGEQMPPALYTPEPLASQPPALPRDLEDLHLERWLKPRDGNQTAQASPPTEANLRHEAPIYQAPSTLAQVAVDTPAVVGTPLALPLAPSGAPEITPVETDILDETETASSSPAPLPADTPKQENLSVELSPVLAATTLVASATVAPQPAEAPFRDLSSMTEEVSAVPATVPRRWFLAAVAMAGIALLTCGWLALRLRTRK